MKTIIFLLIATLFSTVGFGQVDSTTTAVEPKPKATLTIGSVYANDANYYGQKSQEATPYVAVAANYRLKSGLYLSALTYKLLNDKSSTLSAGTFGVGYNFKLSKKLTADISYSHSIYPTYSPLLQSVNANFASVGLVHQSWLNVNLTGDYAFGKTNDAFVTGGISKAINLFSIGKKDIITITPSADVVAGTQHFYQTYVTEQEERKNALGLLLDPITGNPSQGNTTTTQTVKSTDINLLSYNFKLPIAYNRAHYLIEAAYQYSILSKQAQTNPGIANSFATLSFYYQF